MTEKHTSATEAPSQGRTSSPRRVVITGMGVINPIGVTLDSFWDSLVNGRSGIRTVSVFDSSKLPIPYAGEVPNFSAKNYLAKEERKSMKVMARSIQMAVAAAQLALDDAGIDKTRLDPTRFGVEFGSGLMATELQELAAASQISVNGHPATVDMKKWGAEGIPSIPPLWMLKYLPNMLACHVSVLHNAQGPNNTITESDVAGLLAIGEAYHIMQRDQADFFLAGGADSKLNPLSMVRQNLFGKLSRCKDGPEKACRPFDRRRDGLVVGEGSAVLALEDLEHARKRGARIYAEIVGFGASFDRDRSGKGLARAMRTALTEANLTADAIDHVNAFGLSTVPTDIWESKGLREVFGSRPVPVFAAKSYFGSLGAASGPAELIASVLALHHGLVPATLNFEEPDPECPVAVTREPRQVSGAGYGMKISFTDMGQCAALVFRKWE